MQALPGRLPGHSALTWSIIIAPEQSAPWASLARPCPQQKQLPCLLQYAFYTCCYFLAMALFLLTPELDRKHQALSNM